MGWTKVLALGFTQTLAWASSTYLIAIVAQPVARDLHVSASTVFGAFSIALIVMGMAGPAVGRRIDERGGRGALAISNVMLATGLMLLAAASTRSMLFAAWIVLGVGMAWGLYDAAFAALVRIYGARARGPITGITLIAGFASTVGWPISAFLTHEYGWRACALAWAATHIAIALPVNLLFIPKCPYKPRRAHATAGDSETVADASAPSTAYHRRAFVLVTVFAAAGAFVTSAMAAHLPGLLLAVGTSSIGALTAAALVGPAQVASLLVDFLAAQRLKFHPIVTARVAVALHPVGGVLLGLFGGPTLAACVFALLHGAGNGMVTIARGTLPLSIFGAAGYGERQGLIGVSARSMQAFAPFAFGVLLERFGAAAALATSVLFSLVALGALIAIHPRERDAG